MTSDLMKLPTGEIHGLEESSGFEMKPRTLKEAMDFCELMANSDLVPNSYRGKPGNVMVAIQMGNELGLTPMRALRCIAVINGRASMWGDELLAMVLNSPVCEYVDESASTNEQGVCKTKRKGCAEQVSIFTLADAKRAGLLGKQGPWQTNTSRMLKLRARGFGLRDTFADVLAGLVSTEEALDLPRIEPDTPQENILEAAQPLTLKDKLKAKVEKIDTDILRESEQGQVHEPTTEEVLHDLGERDGTASLPGIPSTGVTRDSQQGGDASLLLESEYSDKISLCQSVSETSALLTVVMQDKRLTVFQQTKLRDQANAKMAELRKAKK